MVIKETKEKRDRFQCEDCKLWYNEEVWAEKCEAWCIKYKSCNLEITSHRIK